MLIAVMLVGLAAATAVLYRHLGAKRDAAELWRSSLTIGLWVGTARAVLACAGWYGVEHTGGPLQIPAYALAMLSLPEAVVFGRHHGPVPPHGYVLLALLLVASSMLLVTGVALAVRRRKAEQAIQAVHAADASSEPGCSRDQEQPRSDDDGPDGSRDALTGR